MSAQFSSFKSVRSSSRTPNVRTELAFDHKRSHACGFKAGGPLMKTLLALLPLLSASASATPCTSTQYDMLNWFAMGSSWSQQYHLAGNANPLYTHRSSGIF